MAILLAADAVLSPRGVFAAVSPVGMPAHGASIMDGLTVSGHVSPSLALDAAEGVFLFLAGVELFLAYVEAIPEKGVGSVGFRECEDSMCNTLVW